MNILTWLMVIKSEYRPVKLSWIIFQYNRFNTRAAPFHHPKFVSSTQKTVTSTHPSVELNPQFHTLRVMQLMFCIEHVCVELTGVLNWRFLLWTNGCVELTLFLCSTDGFCGLKRSGPFVLNWCVHLTGVLNRGGPLLWISRASILHGKL